MKHVLIVLFTFFLLIPVRSQQLIGLKKQEVERKVKIYYPGFRMDDSFTNDTYKYLKFIDNENEQTLLVFLSEQDICTSTKLICDYGMLDIIKTRFKKYKPYGKDLWIVDEKGVQYLVRLKKEEWFFSVYTSKKD